MKVINMIDHSHKKQQKREQAIEKGLKKACGKIPWLSNPDINRRCVFSVRLWNEYTCELYDVHCTGDKRNCVNSDHIKWMNKQRVV